MTDNSETTVAVDTDNLDDFAKLLSGKAKPAEEAISEDPAIEDDIPEEDTLAPEDTEAEEEDDVEDVKPEPKKKKSAQERINELTRERREAERREAELIKRLENLESKGKTEPTAVVTEAKAPTPDDVDAEGNPKYPLGEFDPGFARDNVKFILAEERKQMEAEAAIKQRQAAEQQEFEKISSAWAQKIENIEERLPDFAEKGAELQEAFIDIDPVHGDYLASTIMSLEYGPEVLYYLAENLDVAEKIIKMNPVAATIQLGRLETQFIPKKESKPKVSNASEPPPVTTRGTGSKSQVPVDSLDTDLDSFADVFFKKK